MLKERGVFIQTKKVGGVAGATSHKLRLMADAGLDEKNRSHELLKERGVLCKLKEDKLSQGGVARYVDAGEVQSDAEIAQKNRSHATAGFTLLEVIIALSIVGIALIALMGLAQRSITINDQTQQITRATLLAQSKMAEIEAGVETEQGATEAVFPEPDQDYRWRTSYGPTPVTGVQQVDLVVAWGDEKRNEAVRLISFVFRGEP